ncbi:MAG: hypothetical protein AB7V18_16570 [Pyrinomonadaceae bacterium]
MHLPLVISENGSLEFYCTLDYAQIDIEPIDVRNGEYVIYDASGRLLEPKIEVERGIEVVRLVPTSEVREIELIETLISFFGGLDHDEAVLRTMTSNQLAEIGRAYAKDRSHR